MSNNSLKVLSTQLFEVLNTPVSIKILEQLSDKQLTYLYYQYTIVKKADKMKEETGTDLFDEDKEKAINMIKSVLDFGKQKLKPRSHSDKTNNYLRTKLK